MITVLDAQPKSHTPQHLPSQPSSLKLDSIFSRTVGRHSQPFFSLHSPRQPFSNTRKNSASLITRNAEGLRGSNLFKTENAQNPNERANPNKMLMSKSFNPGPIPHIYSEGADSAMKTEKVRRSRVTRLKQAQDHLSPLDEISGEYAGCKGFEAIPEDSSMEHSRHNKDSQTRSSNSLKPSEKPKLFSSVYTTMGKLPSEPPGVSKRSS
jgi:hypothetical protein